MSEKQNAITVFIRKSLRIGLLALIIVWLISPIRYHVDRYNLPHPDGISIKVITQLQDEDTALPLYDGYLILELAIGDQWERLAGQHLMIEIIENTSYRRIHRKLRLSDRWGVFIAQIDLPSPIQNEKKSNYRLRVDRDKQTILLTMPENYLADKPADIYWVRTMVSCQPTPRQWYEKLLTNFETYFGIHHHEKSGSRFCVGPFEPFTYRPPQDDASEESPVF